MKVQYLEELRLQLFSQDSTKLTSKLKAKKQLFLLKIPLFDLIQQKKGQHNFEIIINNIKMIKTGFGDIIFNNMIDRTFNYILKGAIMLFTRTKIDDKNQKVKFYKRLQAGQHFGQKMQYGKEQVDSARAATPSYLLQLSIGIFYTTFAGHFKYQELKDKINFLKSIWIFSQVKRALLERILLSSECRKFSRNSILIQEGIMPTHLLVIIEGELTLNLNKQGKSKAFCVLGKRQVCGLEEIVEDKPYECSAICTSDYVEILRVEREIIIDIVDRDIKPQVLKRRKQLVGQLKQKNLDSKKLTIYSHKQIPILHQTPSIQPKISTNRKRYKSQGGGNPTPTPTPSPPLNKIQVLNTLFNRQIQLKESQLRRYKLQQIQQNNKKLNLNRISTYTNHNCTYDKEIIIKYLGRKQKKYQDILKRQREFIEKRITIIPELKVERSSAVKNQKRKLKYSRKQFYSTLEIYQ